MVHKKQPGLSQRGTRLQPSPTYEAEKIIQELKKSGKTVINLGIGTPPKLLDLMSESMRNEIEKTWRKALSLLGTYYPAAGLVELRKAISRRFGNFTWEEILLTGGGGKGGLHLALFTSTDPGDKVIVPVPCWPTHFDLIKDLGCEIVPLSTYENNFYLDPKSLEKIFQQHHPKPKAILYNSSHNPTGKDLDFKAMLQIDEIATHYRATIISDEAYRGQKLVPSFDFTRYAHRENAGVKIRVVSFSKLVSIAGERLGFIEAPVELINKMASYQSNHSGNPPIAGMLYTLAVLEHPEWNGFHKKAQQALRKKQEAVWKILEKYALDFIKPEGAFYLYLYLPGVKDSAAFAKELLMKYYVGLLPGSMFDPDDCGTNNPTKHHYFRIALGVATLEEIEQGIKRIRKYINTLN